MRERFDELRRMGIRTVMITGDNPLTAQAIAEEAGVDDFLAEATPEDKMALIRGEQTGGKLVAMTGDGTNDAPALAQSDVGVAMNTGTSAAKEAGNMVDLDSNPTKLIEIVEIGKQLLITRGALTTFSIANDVAKYFAIIPAMFAVAYVGLDRVECDAAGDAGVSPSSRQSSSTRSSLSRSSRWRCAACAIDRRSASAMLRRNLLIYGVGGLVAPVHWDQAHRPRYLPASRDRVRAAMSYLRRLRRRIARPARPDRPPRRRLPAGCVGGRPGRPEWQGERLSGSRWTAPSSGQA